MESAQPGIAGGLAGYYASDDVRARIAEYCGGRPDDPTGFSAWHLGGYGGARRLQQPEGAPVAAPKSDFERLLEDGADICRSLADHGGALLHVDLDYTNPDHPAEAYLSPSLCFERTAPVLEAFRRELARVGAPSLALMSARGYHLCTRVPRGSPFYAALVHAGRIGEPLRAKYEAWAGERGVEMGRAHEGAGRLLEHLSHRVVRRLRNHTPVPVTLADVPVPGGGAFVCIDLSAHGDPLFERTIRCPFATNQKSAELAPSRPWTICLPCDHRPLLDLLAARVDLSRAARMAATARTAVPDLAGDDLRWVEEYRAGALARFHGEFDHDVHEEPEAWSDTYDSLDLDALPPCVRFPLAHPNPALLQPRWIRTVTLTLWALGWQPKAIAGLVRSKYERDHGWESMWYRYDAAARADFYVRLFCGVVACGLEGGADFDCATQAARGACPVPECGWDLGRLMDRVAGPGRHLFRSRAFRGI